MDLRREFLAAALSFLFCAKEARAMDTGQLHPNWSRGVAAFKDLARARAQQPRATLSQGDQHAGVEAFSKLSKQAVQSIDVYEIACIESLFTVKNYRDLLGKTYYFDTQVHP